MMHFNEVFKMDTPALRFIAKLLPEKQSIHAYAVEYFPNSPDQQTDFERQVIDSCKTGKLAYFGNIDGWTQLSNEADPWPGTESTSVGLGWLDDDSFLTFFKPCDCLVERLHLDRLLQQAATRNPLDIDKKLIPKQRNRTELSSLIYELLDIYSIEVGEPMGEKSAPVAWGNLVAGKTKSALISKIDGITPGTARIRLNGGTWVDKTLFYRTYNRCFR